MKKVDLEKQLPILENFYPGIFNTIIERKEVRSLCMSIPLNYAIEIDNIIETSPVNFDKYMLYVLFRFLQHSKSFKGDYDGSKDLYSFSVFVKDFSNFEKFIQGKSEKFESIKLTRYGNTKTINKGEFLSYLSNYFFQNYLRGKERNNKLTAIGNSLRTDPFLEVIFKKGGRPKSYPKLVYGTIGSYILKDLESDLRNKNLKKKEKYIFIGRLFALAKILENEESFKSSRDYTYEKYLEKNVQNRISRAV